MISKRVNNKTKINKNLKKYSQQIYKLRILINLSKDHRKNNKKTNKNRNVNKKIKINNHSIYKMIIQRKIMKLKTNKAKHNDNYQQ